MNTILVVDDEAVVRDLITGFLRKLGYNVVVANDGASAIETFHAQETPPVLLVTDIVMPGFDGSELARRLRRDHPRLKVLFITSHSSKKLEPDELAKPLNEYLAKPFSLRSLAAAVTKLMKVDPLDFGTPASPV